MENINGKKCKCQLLQRAFLLCLISLDSLSFAGLTRCLNPQLFHQPVHRVSPGPHYSFPL